MLFDTATLPFIWSLGLGFAGLFTCRARVEAACREIGGQLVEAGQEARSSSLGSHRFSFSFLARNWNSAWGEGAVAAAAWPRLCGGRGGSLMGGCQKPLGRLLRPCPSLACRRLPQPVQRWEPVIRPVDVRLGKRRPGSIIMYHTTALFCFPCFALFPLLAGCSMEHAWHRCCTQCVRKGQLNPLCGTRMNGGNGAGTCCGQLEAVSMTPQLQTNRHAGERLSLIHI